MVTSAGSASPRKGPLTGPKAGDRTTTIRLPLISVTLTRPAGEGEQQPHRAVQTPSRGGALATAGRSTTAVMAAGGVPLSRAAFYAGAVALGALEVVEWPVALLVVAGTYLVDQIRGQAQASVGAAAPGSESPSAGGSVPAPAAAPHSGA